MYYKNTFDTQLEIALYRPNVSSCYGPKATYDKAMKYEAVMSYVKSEIVVNRNAKRKTILHWFRLLNSFLFSESLLSVKYS